jgi:hypothetical protein
MTTCCAISGPRRWPKPINQRHSEGVTAPNMSVASSWNGGEKRNVRLEYIQPSKPKQNVYIERYNRTVRGEWLGQYIFETIQEAQDQAT